MHMQTVEKLKTEWNNFASTKTVGFTFTSIGTGAQNLSTYLALVDKDDPAVRRSNKRIETLLLVNAVFSFVLVAGNLLLLFCKQLPKIVQDTFDFAEPNDKLQRAHLRTNEQKTQSAESHIQQAVTRVQQTQPGAPAAPQVPDGDHLDRGARNIEGAVSPNAGGGSSRGTLAAADRATAIEGENVQQLVPPLAHIGTGMYLLNCINVVMAIAIAIMQVLISERVANSGDVLA